MKRRCIVKYALVVGVVILMYSVGIAPVINATNTTIETKEMLFQASNEKIGETSHSECGCGKDNMDGTEVKVLIFRPTCKLLLGVFALFITLLYIIPGEGSFKYLLYAIYTWEIAMCCFCPWAFLFSIFILH